MRAAADTTADERAFLRAVCDRPDDDLPRLIFADYLDERGDPRGEFIRVQCELERIACRAGYGRQVRDPCGFPGWCRACDLRRRERELLTSHHHVWAAPVAAVLGVDVAPVPAYTTWESAAVGLPWAFRRGFAESVALPCAAFLAHAGALAAACPLAGVTLTDKRPASAVAGNGIVWLWFVAGAYEGADQFGVPQELLARLGGEPMRVGRPRRRHAREYPTEAAALADPSAACVTLARAAAELPPPSPTTK
jgi:uncharacterized protein (TIGR02996 family)